MTAYRALAPAKINLGLFVGPIRASDGRHELTTVMQSISLADELTLEPAPAPAPEGGEIDEVLCPGVPGDPDENLAAQALRAFRERTGWRAPPQRLRIVKRIPVAAGLGGGSADAAAALRLASAASGLGDQRVLASIAAELGADVPAQVSPGRWLASGAGEHLHELPPPSSSFEVLVLAVAAELSTAAVYAEADRLAPARTQRELEGLRLDIESAFAHGAPLPAASELLHNDLQRAAVSLCPQIADVLALAREAGGQPALVSGSGPTVLALAPAQAAFPADRVPAPIRAVAVGAEFAQAFALGAD
jgi:4-diphosphocytidyl-2-C-methyl-D-erythritol kinase